MEDISNQHVNVNDNNMSQAPPQVTSNTLAPPTPLQHYPHITNTTTSNNLFTSRHNNNDILDNNDNVDNDEENESELENTLNGRWSADEHQCFLKGCILFGNNWKKVRGFVMTRNSAQIRSHAQKYLIKLIKKYGSVPPRAFTESNPLEEKYKNTDMKYFIDNITLSSEENIKVEKYILAKFQPDFPNNHSIGQGHHPSKCHSNGNNNNNNNNNNHHNSNTSNATINGNVTININANGNSNANANANANANGSEDSIKYVHKRGRKYDVKKKKMRIFYIEKCTKALMKKRNKLTKNVCQMLNSNNPNDLEQLLKMKEEKKFDFETFLNFKNGESGDDYEEVKKKDNNNNKGLLKILNGKFNNANTMNSQQQQQQQQQLAYNMIYNTLNNNPQRYTQQPTYNLNNYYTMKPSNSSNNINNNNQRLYCQWLFGNNNSAPFY